MQSIQNMGKPTFMQAPEVKMEELNNLFFELTQKSCNLKCSHCYIKRNPYKQEKDFIHLDKIKQSLILTKKENLKCIYLTGGEPMLHPDFNTILRLCLKFSNVTVLSNGTLINDKKARFLRKIDDESNFETIYRISLDHYNEQKNDELRGRGSYRKALLAIQSLYKYEFNPIISVVSYYNESKENLFKGFKDMLNKIDFEFEDINLKIIPYFNPAANTFEQVETNEFDQNNLDCSNSRIVSSKGVFCCPVLCNDFRARVGATAESFSRKVYLDTEKCLTCVKHGTKAFSNDWI